MGWMGLYGINYLIFKIQVIYFVCYVNSRTHHIDCDITDKIYRLLLTILITYLLIINHYHLKPYYIYPHLFFMDFFSDMM